MIGRWLLRVVKFVVAVVLLPLVIGVTIGFFRELNLLRQPGLMFIIGMFSLNLMHLFLFSPSNVMHFGEKILEDLFGFWPPLAAVIPVIVPLYTVLALLLFYIVGTMLGFGDEVTSFFMFIAGFGLAMHLIIAANDLHDEDPGKFKSQYLFSMSLVYIVVLFIVALCLDLNFKGFSFSSFLHKVYEMSMVLYVFLYGLLPVGH